MKSLLNQSEAEAIYGRINCFRPESARQWGRMTPNQMLCHLSDSFLMVMGEREAKFVGNFFMTSLGKWLALKAPMKWPPGVKTGASADQEQDGTKPIEFAQDRQKLLALIHRFTNGKRDFEFVPHPMFGKLTVEEWMRWGYLHCDHHLRQFGV